MHIAHILKRIKSLRTIHLNLDFHDDHGPYCFSEGVRHAWFEVFRHERGPAIVNILQECSLLDYVGLLYHGLPHSTWVEFHPARCAKPRFVLEYDSAHMCVTDSPFASSWVCSQSTQRLGTNPVHLGHAATVPLALCHLTTTT